ncbi:tetratricopeptide repeat protein [Tuwongella immobilis]|uniref:Tetratricopeptide repeat protein n=1 Tax=Tuwongella immobilis TaxID=692036 RepID=A0A6C2YRG5_9BACT|nr:tetratricopeptide repeat protein [Tuwongella immobilis]VIP03575.1 peptidase s1 and s6 chymotrypsin hap : TPR repeat OS=Planctomyces maris DSM 8797 GN=PM8797T_22083 PE=4 SV=1: TPR_2: TPR_19 [Tuwongella immobilis]VTS04518.1 peptidase s1 and s6 chymotrypsin hap : TPR repeat OS=Planctomyces maris DSM 8797 GN=PM8797T_22083 PE=4 SV=1: TPR_2: TPR_19 [Tuwongella immobilis]
MRRLKQIVFGGLLLVGVGFAGQRIGSEVSAGQHYRAAIAAEEQRQFETALSEIEPCLTTWSGSGESFATAARIARRAGDFTRAQRWLIRAEQLGWVPEAIALEKALLAVQQGRGSSYFKYLHDSIDQNHPETLRIIEVLGPAYLQNYQMEQATPLAELWTEKEPTNPTAWFLLGNCREKIRHFAEARVAFVKAVELDGSQLPIRRAVARAHLRANAAEQALPHFQWLMQRDPNDRQARLGMAECARLQQRWGEAESILATLEAQYPNDAEIYSAQGYLAMDQTRFAEAVTAFRKAVANPPYENRMLINLAVALENSGQGTEAATVREQFKQAEADQVELAKVTRQIWEQPNVAEYRYQAGLLMMRNHFTVEAIRWWESVLPLEPNHRPTLERLVEYYEKREPMKAKFLRDRLQPASSPAVGNRIPNAGTK